MLRRLVFTPTSLVVRSLASFKSRVPPAVAKQPFSVTQQRYTMSFCGWSQGEVYRDHFDHGTYVCSKCENPLFKSAAKYKHSTPWPAFTEPISKESLKKYHETEMALKVLCGKCGQGLGHQFLCDGPKPGTSRF